MTATDPLINSMIAAVSHRPEDLPLRMHLAALLVDAGRQAEAVPHLAAVLHSDPVYPGGTALMMRALGGSAPDVVEPTLDVAPGPRPVPPLPGPDPHRPAGPPPTGPGPSPVDNSNFRIPPTFGSPTSPPAPPTPSDPTPPTDRTPDPRPTFDWKTAEREFDSTSLPPPPFLDEESAPEEPRPAGLPKVTLNDVAGMTNVKERLELAFFGPMRHPELAGAYGKSLRGGLLLYGPPGVGKTFLARAVAGEMGAAFLHVSLADVLDQWLGAAEKNVRAVFDAARRSSPCVLFFDEVDAIGQRRSKIGAGWSGMRGAVQQLLTEMDSVGSDNDGVFILAATNAPWDVDPALRRPGRFDRTVLVLPPDGPARTAMLRMNLSKRPIAGINLEQLTRATEGFSGADIVHLCDSAAEFALSEALAAGVTVPIGPGHLQRAMAEVKGSTGPWFDTARNAVLFGNEAGEYDDLLGYMRTHRLI